MGITQRFYDAGHTYGLDNMDKSNPIATANQAVLGNFVDASSSWTRDIPPLGEPATLSLAFSGGFTVTVAFTLADETNVVVSSVSLTKSNTNELLFSVTGLISANESDLSSILAGNFLFTGADNIIGNAFNNTLKGHAGNDQINGGAGIDSSLYNGLKSQYQITKSGTSLVVNGPDGTDTLANVERLKFDNTSVAFDIDGNAGKVYRLYQAAFDRTPDQGGLGVWMNQMDNGQSLEWVSTEFQKSSEFQLRYGMNVSTDQFVTLLYQNVLHRAPDTGGLSAWKEALDAGAQTRAQVLAGFSESPENQVALIGVIQNGVEYTAAG